MKKQALLIGTTKVGTPLPGVKNDIENIKAYLYSIVGGGLE